MNATISSNEPTATDGEQDTEDTIVEPEDQVEPDLKLDEAQPGLADLEESRATAESEDVVEPTEDWEDEELGEDSTELDDEDVLEGAERRRNKERGRTLEFDERLGEVVSRKRHKRSGDQDWQQDWDDEDDY